MKHKITMQFDDFMRVAYENARVRAENSIISKKNMEADVLRPRLDPNKSLNFMIYDNNNNLVMNQEINPKQNEQGFAIFIPSPFDTRDISKVCFQQDEYRFIEMNFMR